MQIAQKIPDLKQRANFTLWGTIKAELEETVPKSKRSQFVERAIARALIDEAKRRALAAIDAAPNVDIGKVDSVEFLRRIRRERHGEITDRHQASSR